MEFHVNGQSGEFQHLINHRQYYLGNPSLVSFETGLRDYSKENIAGQRQKEKTQSTSVKSGFSPLPFIDRKEFPNIAIEKKRAESLKKTNPFYSKESLLWKEASIDPKSLILVSAQ